MPANSYGGLEKERVRKQCWYPLLTTRKESAAEAGRRFRYLTLPGRQLTELRELVESGVVEGPSELILVERDLMDYYTVLREAPTLPFKRRVEPITVIHGDIDVLLSEGKFDEFLPVDAINLDYCGFYWGGDSLDSIKWKSVQRLVEIQSRHAPGGQGQPFTLLITVQGRGGASASISDALAEYREDIQQWEDIKHLRYHGQLLYALPLMVTHLGFRYDYETCCTHRYVYRPTSIGGSATMLAFAFTFEPFKVANLATSYARQLSDLETTRCKQILDSKPVRLVYVIETQELQENQFADAESD